MAKMCPEYEKMLRDGTYDNEEELCNQEGINYDDLYCDEEDED